ncbi:MAG: cyclic nucleotide-binding domain-containing protein [Gammaproteobacteria bacterium]|nr:cyclic nucleotide-binding domain-containing protein [Gammaproteobacteria bacterium]MDH5800114.1 cyclic nucleotide-binding domain-containing protein [Gammaproteobacteria bacterium]
MSNKIIDPAIFSDLVPIKALSPDHCKELAAKSRILKSKAGQALYNAEDASRRVFYVIKGEVELIQKGAPTRSVVGGTKHSKLPLERQQCSAKAKTDLVCLSVDADLLDNMLALEQSGRIELQELEDEDWMTKTLQSSLFHKIPPLNLQSFFMRMEEVAVKSGQMVFNQGSEGDSFYIIRKGQCQVVRQTRSSSTGLVLATLGVGSFFGEEALISDSKRNASVVMTTDGVLMRLKKDDFQELLRDPVLKSIQYSDIMSDPNLVWLDVRLPNEYQSRHLKNSVNVPFPLLRSKLNKLDRSKRYVVYCDTEKLSSMATFLLNQNDIDAFVLDGGLSNVPQDSIS